jgi:hypothetical protein
MECSPRSPECECVAWMWHREPANMMRLHGGDKVDICLDQRPKARWEQRHLKECHSEQMMAILTGAAQPHSILFSLKLPWFPHWSGQVQNMSLQSGIKFFIPSNVCCNRIKFFHRKVLKELCLTHLDLWIEIYICNTNLKIFCPTGIKWVSLSFHSLLLILSPQFEDKLNKSSLVWELRNTAIAFPYPQGMCAKTSRECLKLQTVLSLICCATLTFCCYDKYLRETINEGMVYSGSQFQKFQSTISWFYDY